MDGKSRSRPFHDLCETTPNVETSFATSDPQPAVAQVITQDQVGQQQIVVQTPVLGHDPTQITCSTCHQTVVSKTKRSLNDFAWSLIALFCFVGPIFFWIPLLFNHSYKTTHTCPVCKNTLGIYNA